MDVHFTGRELPRLHDCSSVCRVPWSTRMTVLPCHARGCDMPTGTAGNLLVVKVQLHRHPNSVAP
jgi:hypothetical protein